MGHGENDWMHTSILQSFLFTIEKRIEQWSFQLGWEGLGLVTTPKRSSSSNAPGKNKQLANYVTVGTRCWQEDGGEDYRLLDVVKRKSESGESQSLTRTSRSIPSECE